MQSPRYWSPLGKLNGAVLIAICVCLTVYAVQEQSSEQPTVPSKPVSITPMKPSVIAGLSSAPIPPRIPTPVRMAADKTRDDHWGECAAFTHHHATPEEIDRDPYAHLAMAFEYDKWAETAKDGEPSHITLDGLCHDDKTDEPIRDRPTLHKPKFKPDPKSKWM